MTYSARSIVLLTVCLTAARVAFCETATEYNRSGIAKTTNGDPDGAIADFTKAIEISPKYWAAYSNRGAAKLSKRDWDAALADFTKSIALKPDYAVAYKNRSLAKANKCDLSGAQADCAKAIELKPDYALAYSIRAIINLAKSDAEAAMADCTEAIKLDPNLSLAYRLRGWIYYGMHDFKNSLLDFRKALEVGPAGESNEYARFGIWLTRTQLGEAEAATTELRTYLVNRKIGKPEDWAFKIGLFLTGQMTESAFLTAAKDWNKRTEEAQLCEAYFYTGSQHTFSGDKAGAASYFLKAIATDKKCYSEYADALAELNFLKREKN
jgi:lipoprotein NlpI